MRITIVKKRKKSSDALFFLSYSMDMLKFLGKSLLVVILPIVGTLIASVLVSLVVAFVSYTMGWDFVVAYTKCMESGILFIVFGVVSFVATLMYNLDNVR
jgi:hypothetical protein